MADEAKTSAAHVDEGARWAAPLWRLDRLWSAVDARLCQSVLVAEMLALFLWISLKGLKSEPGDVKGLIYRILVTGAFFAVAAHFAMKVALRGKKNADGSLPALHPMVVTGAAVAGLVLGRLWVGVGTVYFANVLNWLQEGSVVYLVGGVKGLVTRLTFWLALLGGSLATSKGKHISIDVLLRFLPKKLLAPAAIMTWLAAAAMCFAAAVGFSDYLSITQFDTVHPGRPDPKHPSGLRLEACPGNPQMLCDPPVGDKVRAVTTWMRTDLFVLGRQLSLDVRTLPHVLEGDKWDDYMTVPQWNDWVRGADWTSQFGKDKADGFIRDDDGSKMQPVVPRLAAKDGQLVRDLSFVFPFGFVMIGIRFLLRILLVLGRRIKVDPDAAHVDEDVKHVGEDPSNVDAGAAEGAA